MNYKTFLSQNGDYVICEVTGLIAQENSREFTEASNRLLSAANVKRLLTDVRNATNALSVSQNYKYAYKDMGDLNLQRDIRSAILTNEGDRSHDFIETVAQNAGYNVRIFSDEQTAIAWLTDKPPHLKTE